QLPARLPTQTDGPPRDDPSTDQSHQRIQETDARPPAERQRTDREHRGERVGEDVDVGGAQVEVERAGPGRLLAVVAIVAMVVMLVVVVMMVPVAVPVA